VMDDIGYFKAPETLSNNETSSLAIGESISFPIRSGKGQIVDPARDLLGVKKEGTVGGGNFWAKGTTEARRVTTSATEIGKIGRKREILSSGMRFNPL